MKILVEPSLAFRINCGVLPAPTTEKERSYRIHVLKGKGNKTQSILAQLGKDPSNQTRQSLLSLPFIGDPIMITCLSGPTETSLTWLFLESFLKVHFSLGVMIDLGRASQSRSCFGVRGAVSLRDSQNRHSDARCSAMPPKRLP